MGINHAGGGTGMMILPFPAGRAAGCPGCWHPTLPVSGCSCSFVSGDLLAGSRHPTLPVSGCPYSFAPGDLLAGSRHPTLPVSGCPYSFAPGDLLAGSRHPTLPAKGCQYSFAAGDWPEGSGLPRFGREAVHAGDKKNGKKRRTDYTFTMFQTFGVVIPNSPDSLNDPR